MNLKQNIKLEQFGFRLNYAGAHTNRMIMLPELDMLSVVRSVEIASYPQYAGAVLTGNILTTTREQL